MKRWKRLITWMLVISMIAGLVPCNYARAEEPAQTVSGEASGEASGDAEEMERQVKVHVKTYASQRIFSLYQYVDGEEVSVNIYGGEIAVSGDAVELAITVSDDYDPNAYLKIGTSPDDLEDVSYEAVEGVARKYTFRYTVPSGCTDIYIRDMQFLGVEYECGGGDNVYKYSTWNSTYRVGPGMSYTLTLEETETDKIADLELICNGEDVSDQVKRMADTNRYTYEIPAVNEDLLIHIGNKAAIMSVPMQIYNQYKRFYSLKADETVVKIINEDKSETEVDAGTYNYPLYVGYGKDLNFKIQTSGDAVYEVLYKNEPLTGVPCGDNTTKFTLEKVDLDYTSLTVKRYFKVSMPEGMKAVPCDKDGNDLENASPDGQDFLLVPEDKVDFMSYFKVIGNDKYEFSHEEVSVGRIETKDYNVYYVVIGDTDPKDVTLEATPIRVVSLDQLSKGTLYLYDAREDEYIQISKIEPGEVLQGEELKFKFYYPTASWDSEDLRITATDMDDGEKVLSLSEPTTSGKNTMYIATLEEGIDKDCVMSVRGLYSKKASLFNIDRDKNKFPNTEYVLRDTVTGEPVAGGFIVEDDSVYWYEAIYYGKKYTLEIIDKDLSAEDIEIETVSDKKILPVRVNEAGNFEVDVTMYSDITLRFIGETPPESLVTGIALTLPASVEGYTVSAPMYRSSVTGMYDMVVEHVEGKPQVYDLDPEKDYRFTVTVDEGKEAPIIEYRVSGGSEGRLTSRMQETDSENRIIYIYEITVPENDMFVSLKVPEDNPNPNPNPDPDPDPNPGQEEEDDPNQGGGQGGTEKDPAQGGGQGGAEQGGNEQNPTQSDDKKDSDKDNKNPSQGGEQTQPSQDTGKNPPADLAPVPAATGTKLTDISAKCDVKVISDDKADPQVAYVGASDKKATKVTVPEKVTIDGVTYKVTSIADKAFSGNKNLKTVTVGSNITSIGKSAFKNCKNLQKVEIKSKNITKIGADAFSGNKNLARIVIKSTKIKSIGKNALKGTSKKLVIKVPKSKLKEYKKLFKNKGNKNVKVTK